MVFSINTLDFQNTGDVATDTAVDMSELDPKAVDAARITLDASEEEDSGFDDYEFTKNKVYFAASDSESRRMIDLISDSTNYVRAQASNVNFEESITDFSDLFGTTVFEDRVLSDNDFLERVVHSENGFDEVFTNNDLYSNIVGDVAKESVFISSFYIIDRGWDQEASKLWSDLFDFDDSREDTGVDGKRLFIDDEVSFEVDADVLRTVFFTAEWRDYDSENDSFYTVSVDGTERYTVDLNDEDHGVKTNNVDLTDDDGTVTVSISVSADTTPTDAVLDIFDVEADEVI